MNITIEPEEYRVILELLMVADPWPLSEPEHKLLLTFADRMAKQIGMEDWIDAFHKMDRPRCPK